MNGLQSKSTTESDRYLLCYTREPQDGNVYSPKLAYSMHLAYSEDGERFVGLNHNSGVLFAKAVKNEKGALQSKGLKNPFLFDLADGRFGVMAIRIECDGKEDEQSKGGVLVFTSEDLLQYDEVGVLDLKGGKFVDEAICHYQVDEKSYRVRWRDKEGNYYENTVKDVMDLKGASKPKGSERFCLDYRYTDVEGMVPRNVIRIPEEVGKRIERKLSVPYNVKIEVPECVHANSKKDVQAVKATAYYNDGSESLKSVDWNMDAIDWDTPGTYQVTGTVYQDSFDFPIALNRADPCVAKWKGKYYFIATNDENGHKNFFIREADSISGLVKAKEVEILNDRMYEHVKNNLWAPELHAIGEELYIFFASSPDDFRNISCRVMKLKKNGDPLTASDWEEPIRMRKKDGTFLFESGITLDMTNFVLDGTAYVVWAQRELEPYDLGSWLYIATIDKDKPWMLTSDPVVLSKPEYGWANNHTFVDEGPFPLITKTHVFLTFSSAFVDSTYCVGILTAGRGTDLLNPDNWVKGNYPLLTSRSISGEYGPGHNSYVIDDDGNVWNAYHARHGLQEPRSSGIRRVHFDVEGYPVLDLTKDRDLNPSLRYVTTRVKVG